MSRSQPKRTKRYVPYYPAQLKMLDGNIISTGPYDKVRCGSTQKEVTEFLVHLTEIYERAVREKADKIAEDIAQQKVLADEDN